MQASGLTPSHRLIVTAERWARLRSLPDHPVLRLAAEGLKRDCAVWAADRTITVDETSHNWHLIRARTTQLRVVSLLVQYGVSGNRLFRDAALDYLRDLAGWEYWSWITWREGNADPNAIFDLSYGENAFTLALAWDWLAGELTPAEREGIIRTARQRAFLPYLARNGFPGQEMWYYRKPDTNWNTVCNGGVGLLALALGDAAPESAQILDLVEEGVRHYFEYMQDDGAWPEGIGYWGYGHRYGYYYLLSRERRDGKPHPLLERPGSRNTLRFPLLFSPNNTPASFGDVNDFSPLPFHFAAAVRYGMTDVLQELDRRILGLVARDKEALSRTGAWPGLAELMLFHPGEIAPVATDWPRTSIQHGLEWSYLADQWPQPRLYASVRGGTTDAPHTHQDLTALLVVVGAERLIDNAAGAYIDTTFSKRRFEMYEHSAASKNVFLVNGVGLPHPATVSTVRVQGDGWEGVLLDATSAAVVGSPVLAYGRAVVMLGGSALLVVDRLQVAHPALAETRFHSFAQVRYGKNTARLAGKAEGLHLAFAADVAATVKPGLGLSTHVRTDPDRVIRWMTLGLHREMTLVTLLTPNGTGCLRLDGRKHRIHAAGPGFDVTLFYPAEGLGLC